MAYLDITKLVIEQTDVDEEAAKLASSVCQGNERKSWLNKVEVYIDPNGARIVIEIRLQNRHAIWVGVGRFKKKVVVYSDTFNVKFTAFLNSDCTLGGYVATSENAVWQVLGAFATLLANNPHLSGAITSKICPLLSNVPAGFAENSKSIELATPVLPNASVVIEDADLYSIDYGSCLEDIQDANSDKIVCSVLITLTSNGKERIKESTYGIVTSLTFQQNINLQKSSLTGIFKETVIQLPRVEIEIVINPESPDGRLPVSANVAPSVSLLNGVAVDASINMSGTEGLPAFLAARLEREVNDNGQIRRAIVDFINSLK